MRPMSFRNRMFGGAVATGVVLGGAWLAAPRLGGWLSDRALAAGRGEEALLWLERLSPGDAKIDILKAGRERRAGNYAQAAVLVESALQKGYPADQCLREQVLIEARRGRLAAAEPYLAELMRASGHDAVEVYDALSHGFLLNIRISEAKAILQKWASEFPSDHRPLAALARIEGQFWNFSAAEALLRKAAALSPAGEIRLQLAEILLTNGQVDEALEFFGRGLAADRPRALLGKAKCLRAKSRPEAAEEALREVLDADPENAEALLELARLEVDADAHAQAIPLLERVLRRQPWNSPAEVLLMGALRSVGRTSEAEALQGRVDAAQKASARGRRLLDELLKHPTDPRIRCELGKLALQHDDPLEAVGWLHSVLELDPRHEEAQALHKQALAAVKQRSKTGL